MERIIRPTSNGFLIGCTKRGITCSTTCFLRKRSRRSSKTGRPTATSRSSSTRRGLIMLVRELTTRRYTSKPTPIRGPDDVVGIPAIRKLMKEKREHFVVLLLNARHECQEVHTISIGSLNASICHPREIFLPAVVASAASLVCVHNHPSGDPEPSEEDISITRRLVEVGELIGIGVLDHVIVASRGVVSFRARQLL